MRVRTLSAVLILSFVAATASGANLLTNPTFDSGLQGWTNTQSSSVATDWDSGSQAARLRWTGASDPPPLSFRGGLKQSVPVVGGAAYSFGGRISLSVPTADSADAKIFLDFRDASGQPLALHSTPLPAVPPNSGFVSKSNSVTAPAGAQSADISFAVSDTAGLVALFDDVFLDGAAGAQPPSITFSASPTSIMPGQTSTLSWSVQNATTVTIDNGIGTVGSTGSRVVTPAKTTTYKLTATGAGASSFKQITITLLSAPTPAIVAFTASPQTIQSGGSSTLVWSTRDAASVTIDNGVGSVALSGMASVSPPATTTYTLTATGPGGRTIQQTTVTVISTRPGVEFNASPAVIAQGQSSTLTWTTTNATSVTIDNGRQALSGSLIVTPSVTTSYILTATGPAGEFKRRTTVFVLPGDVPIVVVSRFPEGIVEVAGRTASDRYALTNLGKVSTSITLSQTGTFFTQSPATFTLGPGATQVVTITTTPQTPGRYVGVSTPSGEGVRPGLFLRVVLFVAPAPLGRVTPNAQRRVELSAPANQNPSGTVTFTNDGNDTLQGIAVSDVAWLIPDDAAITIPPGGNVSVAFSIDRSLRPDADAPVGAAFAKLSLVYLDSTSSTSSTLAVDGSGSSSSTATFSISLVDVVTEGATPGSPSPLAAGEIAVFAPGIPQKTKLSGDLLLSTLNSVSDLRLFFTGPGATSLASGVDPLGPNSSLSLPSVLKTVFATTAPAGTVQARTSAVDEISVAAVQTDTTFKLGTYITALPTFRSDRAIGPSESLYLPGVEKGNGRQTDLVVQETAGFIGSAQIDFLDSSGSLIGAREPDAISSFGLLSVTDAVPEGTAAIRITNASTGGARIVAYALVNGASLPDAWLVTDATLNGATSPMFVPLLPSSTALATGANDLYVINTGSIPLAINIETVTPGSARRRTVRTSSLSSLRIEPEATTVLTVDQLQTVKVPVGNSGYVRVTASGSFVLSARSTLTASLLPSPFGTALPVLSGGMSAGQSILFSGVDDASANTIAKETAATYRTALGLLETSGTSSNVRLTLRYKFSAGTRTTAEGVSTLDTTVAAGQMIIMKDLSRTIIGAARDGYGDLHNMQLDVEVLSGRVIPFLQVIDNGSADSTIRTE